MTSHGGLFNPKEELKQVQPAKARQAEKQPGGP